MLWLGLPQEANSETETSVQGIFRECSWHPTLVEGKKAKLGRVRSWAAVQLQWTSQPRLWGVLKMDWALNTFPTEWDSQASLPLHHSVIGCSCPGRGVAVSRLFSPETTRKRLTTESWLPAQQLGASDLQSWKRIWATHLHIHHSKQTEKPFSFRKHLVPHFNGHDTDLWWLISVQSTRVLYSLPLPNPLWGSSASRTYLPILHIGKLTTEKSNRPVFNRKPSSI